MTARLIKLLILCLLIPSVSYAARTRDTGVDTGKTWIQVGAITWYLDDEYTVGQYANNDYYVVCPTGCDVESITPAWDGTGNGCMVNPSGGAEQGYHNEIVNDNNPYYNAALNACTSFPISLTGGDALISATDADFAIGTSQWDSYISGSRMRVTYVEEAAVLTVVSSAPPANSFRPGYSDSSISGWTTADIDYDILPHLPVPPPAYIWADPLGTVEGMFEEVWVDHGYASQGRMTHPNSNMPDFGKWIAYYVSSASLTFLLDYTDVQMEPAMINFIQYAIDLYSVMSSVSFAGGFPPDGGHSAGRKWPVLFAGLILGDTDMQSIGDYTGDHLLTGSYGSPPVDYFGFGEDSQTFYVTQDAVDLNTDYTGYIGMPEWGINHATSPSNDGPSWTINNYRTSDTMGSWAGFVLAARVMGAKSLWNHDALFDYADRYYYVQQGDPDPFGYTVPNQPASGTAYPWFQGYMWDTYRDTPCSATISQGSTESCNVITQYDITWTLAANETVGQFITGGYFVVDDGDVQVSAISPTPVYAVNASMLNPVPTYDVDGDSWNYKQGYTITENCPAWCDWDSGIVAADLPLTLPAGSSLISVSYIDGGHDWIGNTNVRSHVENAAILTVLSSQPASGAFRPPYVGTNKPIYTTSQINTSILPNLDRTGMAEPFTGYYWGGTWVEYLERGITHTWLQNHPDTDARGIAPTQAQPDYHKEIGMFLSDLMVTLMTDEYTTPMLYGLIQLGIDQYWMVLDGNASSGIYGQVIALTAALLEDEDMLDMFPSELNYHETRERAGFYTSGTPGWTGATALFKKDGIPYETDALNTWTTTPHCRAETYRGNTDSHPQVGTTFAVTLAGATARAALGADWIIAYMKRFMTEDFDGLYYDSYYAQCNSLYGASTRTNYQTSGSDFVNDMWNTYGNKLFFNQPEGAVIFGEPSGMVNFNQ